MKESDGRKVVAIIGASGFIGMRLVSALVGTKDYRVKVLTRNPNLFVGDDRINLEITRGDLLVQDSLHGFFEPGCTVVNLAYLSGGQIEENLVAINNLLNACKVGRVRRLVHCSTADVVGRTRDNPIRESTPCNPISRYGRTKLALERTILSYKGCFDIAILRPTAVFGPEGRNLNKLARDVMSGGCLRNYLKSCLFADRRMNLVPVSNVVAAIQFLMRQEVELNGEIFIISSDENQANNFADVETFLMKSFQLKSYALPKIPIPTKVLGFFLYVLGKDNINPLSNYSSNKLRDYGFEPPVTFEAGLEEYVGWLRSTPLV